MTSIRKQLMAMQSFRWRRYFPTFLLVALLAGFFGACTAFFVDRTTPGQIIFTAISRPEFREQTNILLVGVDDYEDPRRADSIMVLHINPATNQTGLLSIPRDARLQLRGFHVDKVNHAYAYGGVELLRQSVEDFLGVSIPYYAVVTFEGLVKMVDRLGGVTIDVDHRMVYHDRAGKLAIDLAPGVQRLDGYRAMGYVRFRHDLGGDFARMRRQQKFLQAVSEQLNHLGGMMRIPFVVKDLLPYVATNLRFSQIAGLARKLKEAYDQANIEMATLVGEPTAVEGVYYLLVDEADKRDQVNRLLKERQVPRAIGTFSVQYLPSQVRVKRLAVLGNDHPWLLEQVMRNVQAYGGNVVARKLDQQIVAAHSRILVNQGGVAEGKKLARILGIPNGRVNDLAAWGQRAGVALGPEYFDRGVDLVIFVGRDWGGYPMEGADLFEQKNRTS